LNLNPEFGKRIGYNVACGAQYGQNNEETSAMTPSITKLPENSVSGEHSEMLSKI